MKDFESKKPVRFFSPNYNFGSYFGYENNQKKLNFLPTFFLIIFIISVLVLSFIRLTAFSKNGVSSLPFSSKAEIPSDQIYKDNIELNRQLSKFKTGSDTLQDSSSSGEILVLQSANQEGSCTLSFTKEINKNIKIKANQQGFWKMQECEGEDLDFIQIIKIPDLAIIEEIEQNKQIEVQLLDKNIYAVLYKDSTQKFSYNLAEFARLLAIPVFPEEGWFREVEAFDIYRSSEKTYYLDEYCNQIQTDKVCTLWALDNFSNKLSVIIEDITKLSSALDLNQKSVKFSKNQEGFPAQIQLIFISSQDQDNLKVVTVDLSNSRVLSQIEINKQENPSSFNKIYR